MIPSEFETSLPSFYDRCRVREVAVEFLGSWLSSYDPY